MRKKKKHNIQFPQKIMNYFQLDTKTFAVLEFIGMETVECLRVGGSFVSHHIFVDKITTR